MARILHRKVKSSMAGTIVITNNDYSRLMTLMEFDSWQAKMPHMVSRLQAKLSSARMLQADQIENEIVTMNSRVRLKDLQGEREAELTITYPQDADPKERKVSVLSEIGMALLGRKEKEIVNWKVPTGMGAFEILEVTYQPEAAGHFYL